MQPQIIKLGAEHLDIVRYIADYLVDHPNPDTPTKHLLQLAADDRTWLFAVLLGDEIIGYALAYSFPSLYSAHNMAYLYDIEVLEPYRRRGVGRQLIVTIKHHLKAANVHEFYLGTAVRNAAGQALFSKTGDIRSEEAFNDFTYYLQEE